MVDLELTYTYALITLTEKNLKVVNHDDMKVKLQMAKVGIKWEIKAAVRKLIFPSYKEKSQETIFVFNNVRNNDVNVFCLDFWK